MTTISVPITGFVDVIGKSSNILIYGYVDIVNGYPIESILHVNNLTFSNPQSDQPYQQVPAFGYIKDGDSGVPYVRVSFIKNGVTIDYYTTGSDGKYAAFIEPGVYDIKINSNSYNTTHQSVEIKEGLKSQFYYTIKSTVVNRYDDVIEFNGTSKKLITGVMTNQDHKVLSNVEIIISQDDKVVTYFKTNKNGKYNFALDNGNYDVRIRGNNKPIKIIKDFNFESGKGFFTEIKQKYNTFGREDWIWIYQ
jgi:hypothetical protein